MFLSQIPLNVSLSLRHIILPMNKEEIERLREELANMDCYVDFPKTEDEAAEFKDIIENLESNRIKKSHLRMIKEWEIYPWFLKRLSFINHLEIM